MTANPVIIGAVPNRSRSPHGERRSPSSEARDRETVMSDPITPLSRP